MAGHVAMVGVGQTSWRIYYVIVDRGHDLSLSDIPSVPEYSFSLVLLKAQ